MASVDNTLKDPIIVIVGQTASGKSDLAMKVARRYKGEIICADSRTIYKGMDIGTAKPSKLDRQTIPHHMLDVIEPSQAYSASEFKNAATLRLNQIHTKNKLPIVVGGTGLYINSLVYDFDFGRAPSQKLRLELQNLPIEELQNRVKDLGLDESNINFKNKRHLIRAVENGGIVKSGKPLDKRTLLLGISLNNDELRQRIAIRNEEMIQMGLMDEVKGLVDEYGWDAPGLNSIAYKEWRGYFDEDESIEQVKQKMFKSNWQYARRQKIWFKRDDNIYWSDSVDDLIRQVDQFLIQC